MDERSFGVPHDDSTLRLTCPLRASIAVHTMWSRCDDRASRTEAAREAAFARFERQVDPEGLLPPQERRQRAESARRAHMRSLALRRSTACAKTQKTPATER